MRASQIGGGVMRNASILRQKCWYSKKETVGSGFQKKEVYIKPVLKYLTVSATAGIVDNLSVGLVPEYDRTITSFEKLPVDEGYVWWIDRTPQLEDDGELSVNEDGTPVTPPDYSLVKILSSQKQIVQRYGISKIGGN